MKIHAKILILGMRNLLRANVHKETLQLVVVTAIGGLAPLLVGALLARAFSQLNGWDVFWQNGEFYLYSAGFLTSAIYLFFANKKKTADVLSVFFWLSIGALLAACILYAALAASLEVALPDGRSFDKKLLVPTSHVLLVFSLMMYYISNYVDFLKRDVDVSDEERRDIDRIVNRLK